MFKYFDNMNRRNGTNRCQVGQTKFRRHRDESDANKVTDDGATPISRRNALVRSTHVNLVSSEQTVTARQVWMLLEVGIPSHPAEKCTGCRKEIPQAESCSRVETHSKEAVSWFCERCRYKADALMQKKEKPQFPYQIVSDVPLRELLGRKEQDAGPIEGFSADPFGHQNLSGEEYAAYVDAPTRGLILKRGVIQ